MPGVQVTAEIIEGKEIAGHFQDAGSVKKPLENGIKRLTLKLEGEAKKATVVDTGRLRSSMTHRFMGQGAEIGTNVQYASYVEYGTEKMEARHMEGATKVFGLGMLGYAVERIKEWAKKEGGDIAKNIAEKICYGR